MIILQENVGKHSGSGSIWRYLQTYHSNLKPGAHERKQLSKKFHEAVSSAVSSRVRVNFGEAKIIKHVRYLSHDLARQKCHQNLRAHGKKQLS